MGYAAKIVKDSVSPDGVRLTSFEVTAPRIILAEVNTHKMISKSSASSRAIPVERRIAMIEEDPFVPESFGKNQRGMQASEDLEGDEARLAKLDWLGAKNAMVARAGALAGRGVHKQHANRLLEPFAWHTMLLTGTEWENFFNLRAHPKAQPEFQKAARMMRELYDSSTPKAVNYGEWHLPYVDGGELFDAEVLGGSLDRIPMISSARCARLSYLTQDGVRDQVKDMIRASRLLEDCHMSPFEHVARVASPEDRTRMRFEFSDIEQYGEDVHQKLGWSGNLRGWVQFRKMIPGEAVFRG